MYVCVCWFCCFAAVPDFFEDGLPPPAQAYLKVCSAVSEASLNDMKPSSPPAVRAPAPQGATPPSSGATVQRRSVLHAEEIVRLPLMFSIGAKSNCRTDLTYDTVQDQFRVWSIYGWIYFYINMEKCYFRDEATVAFLT